MLRPQLSLSLVCTPLKLECPPQTNTHLDLLQGSPRQWQNRPTPYSVHADDGISFVDQNGHRFPSAVLLPLITAVDRKSELNDKPFDWASVDFVTDRNGLRKLLRWIGGNAGRDFRIDMQLAGTRTILLNRWEVRTSEQMSGYTFGFNFEKASTKSAPGCEKSTGHHRIVQYVSFLYIWFPHPLTHESHRT
jgi:hypothetical protein